MLDPETGGHFRIGNGKFALAVGADDGVADVTIIAPQVLSTGGTGKSEFGHDLVGKNMSQIGLCDNGILAQRLRGVGFCKGPA